jgi:hypothetical protein
MLCGRRYNDAPMVSLRVCSGFSSGIRSFGDCAIYKSVMTRFLILQSYSIDGAKPRGNLTVLQNGSFLDVSRPMWSKKAMCESQRQKAI